MQLLVIKTNGLEANPEYALLGKKQAQDRFTPGDWKRVRSLTRGRRVLVLLPSDQVVLSSVSIPSKNRKQLLQAVPYALEDTLAEDIEDLHFSVQQDSDSNNSHVAIVNRTVLAEMLDHLKSQGITAHFILPQILTQICDDKAWSIIYESNGDEINTKVRLDKFSGFVCTESMLDLFLSEQLEKNTPESIHINTDVSNLPASLEGITVNTIDSAVIDYKSAMSALDLNLLSNFSRQEKSPSIDWSVWKPSMTFAGLLIAIWGGIFFWQNNVLKQQSKQLNQQIEQVYKETFPKGRIVDAASQMSSALNKLKSSVGKSINSPLPLIANVSPLFKEYKDLALSELRYQENQLTLTIESPNLTRLETFKREAAEKHSLKIDIKESMTTSDKVKAVIIVSPLSNSTAENDTHTAAGNNS